MKIVGNHLAQYAITLKDEIEFDRFSRSAFNRYYYSAFLEVRSTLKSLDVSWAKISHQSMPEVLRGQVLERLKKEIRKSEKNGLISSSDGQQKMSGAANAVTTISDLLVSARETRRLADYEPEIRVARNGTNARLGEWSMDAARNWEQRVRVASKTILKTYHEFGLI